MPRKKKEEIVEDVKEVKKVRKTRKVREAEEVQIDENINLMTKEEKKSMIWLDLKAAMKSKKILSGRLEGIENTSTGTPIAVVYYKDIRVVIPATEMMIDINEYEDQSRLELNNRYSQILSRTMGADIDFIIVGIDKKLNSVVASRNEAMYKKRQQFYLNEIEGKPRIRVGRKVEARVIAVGDKVMRIEIFGVETTISAKDAAWEWIEDLRDYYTVGDRIFVKIMELEARDINNIRVVASIKEATENPAKENIKKCVVQGKYIGKVTGIDSNAIFVRLNVGVNAIAHTVHDRKIPCRKDEVSFVVTKIDEEKGVAIGIISKVLKQFI